MRGSQLKHGKGSSMRRHIVLLTMVAGAFAAAGCAMGGLGLTSQNAYSDTYYNASDASRDAERAAQERIEAEKAEQQMRLAEAQRAKELAEQEAKQPKATSTTRVLGPNDFDTYQEYRDYVDRLGESKRKPANSTSETSAAQPNNTQASVVNNYYIGSSNTPYEPACVTTSYVYYETPSLWWDVLFDPWFCVSYRRHYSWWPYYYGYYGSYYDPYWHYAWSPWPYHSPYHHWYGGYWDGYHQGWYDGYYGGWYGGYWESYPVPPVYQSNDRIQLSRSSEMSSMSSYGRAQRSAYAQTRGSSEFSDINSRREDLNRASEYSRSQANEYNSYNTRRADYESPRSTSRRDDSYSYPSQHSYTGTESTRSAPSYTAPSRSSNSYVPQYNTDRQSNTSRRMESQPSSYSSPTRSSYDAPASSSYNSRSSEGATSTRSSSPSTVGTSSTRRQ